MDNLTKHNSGNRALVYRFLRYAWLGISRIYAFCLVVNILYAIAAGYFSLKMMFMTWPENIAVFSWLVMAILWPLLLPLTFLTALYLVYGLVKGLPRGATAGLLARWAILLVLGVPIILVGWYENFRNYSDPALFVHPKAAIENIPAMIDRFMAEDPPQDLGFNEEEPAPDAKRLFLRPQN